MDSGKIVWFKEYVYNLNNKYNFNLCENDMNVYWLLYE